MAEAPFTLTDADRITLAMTDEEFVPHTWHELQDAIAKNDMSTLKRSPSILRRYITWSQETIAKHGSTAAFLLQKRLLWDPSASLQSVNAPILIAKPAPFVDKADYKVLYNDWPYGVTSDITHLVIWFKVPLLIDPKDDEKWARSSENPMHKYVCDTFRERMRQEGGQETNVIYFKNEPWLQSVSELEHFHVFIRGAKQELLDEWTDGDVPMYKIEMESSRHSLHIGVSDQSQLEGK